MYLCLSSSFFHSSRYKINKYYNLLTSISLIQFIPLFLLLYFHSFIIIKLILYFFRPLSFFIQFLFLFLIFLFLLFLFYIIQHISFPLTVNFKNYLHIILLIIFIFQSFTYFYMLQFTIH